MTAMTIETGTENQIHDAALVRLDTARHALAECKTVMEAKQVADAAEAARVYLQRTNASVEMVSRAREIQVLAEQQMGAFLKAMEKSTGAMGIGTSAVVRGDSTPPTLAEMGISRDRAARAQKLADIPAPEIQERIAVLKASGDQPTPSKVLQFPIRKKHPQTHSGLNRAGNVEEREPDPSDHAALKRYAVTVFKRWLRGKARSQQEALAKCIGLWAKEALEVPHA